MASVQVRDILDSIRVFYSRLSERFKQAQQTVQGDQLPFLLEYIAMHEAQLGTGIEEFEENAESSLLDTWLQFGADETLDETLNKLRLEPDMTEDDVLAEALKVDAKLIALYEELAGESSAPHVRELFEALAKMQEARERQLARAIQ